MNLGVTIWVICHTECLISYIFQFFFLKYLGSCWDKKNLFGLL